MLKNGVIIFRPDGTLKDGCSFPQAKAWGYFFTVATRLSRFHEFFVGIKFGERFFAPTFLPCQFPCGSMGQGNLPLACDPVRQTNSIIAFLFDTLIVRTKQLPVWEE